MAQFLDMRQLWLQMWRSSWRSAPLEADMGAVVMMMGLLQVRASRVYRHQKVGTNCPQVAMPNADGIVRKTLAGNVEPLLCSIQSIPQGRTLQTLAGQGSAPSAGMLTFLRKPNQHPGK